MKKSNAAFTTFLDEKFIPLAPKVKLAITALIVLLPLVLFYFLFYQPKHKRELDLVDQKVRLTRELDDVKKRAADLKKFEADLAAAEQRFLETSILLPKEKEIPTLLKDISSLGRTAGLDFLTFQPMGDIPKDFYAEIPVQITVNGPYHNVGFFFDQVSKLERIVSVTNIRMGSPKRESLETLLTSNCRLVTYRFTNVELPKPKKK